VLLGVCIAVAFFQVFVFDAYERVWLGFGNQSIYYTIDLAGLTSFLITSALFLAWFHRTYRNAAVLGAGDLQFSAGWAVGWWFVPIACFSMPYRAAVEIWKVSSPRAPATTGGQAMRADSSPTLITVWWVTWLVCVALVNVDAVANDPTAGSNWLWPLANASVVLAAVLSILVVRSASKRQDAKWRQRVSMAPSLPTPAGLGDA
jgi:hypothetical protein